MKKPLSTRRQVLGWTVAASAAALLQPRVRFAVAKDPDPKKDGAPVPGKGAAQRMVLVYMAGGATQFETWAPKKKGTANMGPAEPINTSVPGIEVGSHMKKIAERMDDIAVIRSVTSREGNHDRGRYFMHAGYIPNPTVMHPGIGSYVAHEVGSSDSVLPNFVSIGGTQGSGYLGVEWDPFVVNNPNSGVDNINAHPSVSRRRLDARLSLLGDLNEEFESERGDESVAPHRNMFERAKRLMYTSKNRAFDVSEEPDSVHKLYGESTFGKGCIAARRLLEAGVKVVEVVQGGWDTHNNEHDAVRALAEAMDPGVAGLLKDLKDRGMLDTTLVYWFTEFGRSPRLGDGGNGPGGRGHYPEAFSVAFAGGGVRGGRVIGETDPDGVMVTQRPVQVQDLHASVCDSLGIDQDKQYFAGRRPMRVVDKGGMPVSELYS